MASYLTKEEMEMTRVEVNLQIALWIQSCKPHVEVTKLLDDVREHERHVCKSDRHRFSDADGNPD